MEYCERERRPATISVQGLSLEPRGGISEILLARSEKQDANERQSISDMDVLQNRRLTLARQAVRGPSARRELFYGSPQPLRNLLAC